MIFIGIKELVADQNLSLLWEFAEGTRKTDKIPPVIEWLFLADNRWIKLNDEYRISDSTHGFQTTGILEFSIPSQANNKNTIFDIADLFWFCASIESDADAFPQLINITTNAVTASFKNNGNDPDHFALPLPAKKINRFTEMLPAIKKIDQPVASFNGKMKEDGKEYYIRVSERLRHKSRAINNWDYERLVLENFPSVFKVKCLNNYLAGYFAAGHVTVVLISDLRNKNENHVDILFPKTSYIVLKNIEKLLSSKSSPFVKVHAINPQLDQVLVNCKVKFNKGFDKGFYLQKLNEDLIEFLTPWILSDVKSLSFSVKIYASSVINFIDKREYIDYVADLEMNQYTEHENGDRIFCKTENQSISLVETQFTSGHSILVSAPGHNIELIE